MSGRVPNFDRIAHIYRWAEYLSLGPLLQRARTHFIPQVADCRSTLVLGDGDGRFLAELLSANTHIEGHAVDISATMLHLLKQRCRAAGQRLSTSQCSAFDITPATRNDLIVSHFFLDCFSETEVSALIRMYTERLQPGALWLVSDFFVPNKPLIRPLARLYIRALYFAFRVLTGLRPTKLPDTAVAFTANGFHRIAREEWLYGMLYTELWKLE